MDKRLSLNPPQWTLVLDELLVVIRNIEEQNDQLRKWEIHYPLSKKSLSV